MLNLRKNLDLDSLTGILITLVLFIVVLFEKGLTHDPLLEAAISLVSVKLILLGYKNSQGIQLSRS